MQVEELERLLAAKRGELEIAEAAVAAGQAAVDAALEALEPQRSALATARQRLADDTVALASHLAAAADATEAADAAANSVLNTSNMMDRLKEHVHAWADDCSSNRAALEEEMAAKVRRPKNYVFLLSKEMYL